jgi:hypothetical protein
MSIYELSLKIIINISNSCTSIKSKFSGIWDPKIKPCFSISDNTLLFKVSQYLKFFIFCLNIYENNFKFELWNVKLWIIVI